MIRDCKDWRACLKRAREAAKYSAQRAIWTIMSVYGSDYAERMDKTGLVGMVHALTMEHGLATTYQEAEQAVEDWYEEGLV